MISKPLHVLSLFFCCVGIFIYTATRKLSVKSSIGIYPHGKAKNTNERDDILNSFVSTLRSHRSLDTSNHSHNNVAPWIPDHGRKVLFVELLTWEDYYNKLKKTTGEYYVSATWDYALRRNGFVVDRVSTKQYYDRMTKSELLVYHRIFVRDPRWHHYYDDKNILCRVRPMYFYGGWVFGKNDHNYRFNAPFAQTQILSANREEKNSFLGYFPHNILQPDEQRPFRKKVGFLLGKMPHYFDGHGDVIKALLDAGFELHSTCTDLSTKVCPLPQEIIRHGSMTPIAFANLMTQFSFMLGFVEPKGSPSPLVGISYGVTFLNPIYGQSKKEAQHKILSRISFPYSYIIDLDNKTAVVEAAEIAFKHRFSSYVPPSYRIASLVNRMRYVLEDESLCLLPTSRNYPNLAASATRRRSE